MSSRFKIVQRIENQVKTPKPSNVELRVLNIVMVCDDLDIRVEFLGCFLGYLYLKSVGNPICTAIHGSFVQRLSIS